MREPAGRVRLSLAAFAATAAVLPTKAQTVLAREQVFHRSTAATGELRLFTYARFHLDCRPDDPPRIELRSPAEHGSVALRPRPSAVSALREGEYDRTGHTCPGTAVRSFPAPGFHGADRLDWDVVGDGRMSHDTALVEVR